MHGAQKILFDQFITNCQFLSTPCGLSHLSKHVIPWFTISVLQLYQAETIRNRLIEPCALNRLDLLENELTAIYNLKIWMIYPKGDQRGLPKGTKYF